MAEEKPENIMNSNAQEVEYTVEELLIECVRARPPLWDSRLPITERSKAVRDELWLDIYKEFGEQEQFSADLLIKKWRNLRDTYVRLKGDYESYTPSGSGGKAKKKKMWQYYDIMSFLKDTFCHRPTTSNVSNLTDGSLSSSSPDDVNSFASASNPTHKGTKRKYNTENAIIDAINRINVPAACPVPPAAKQYNEICNRISQISEKMPQRERTELEINLLQLTFEKAKDFL